MSDKDIIYRQDAIDAAIKADMKNNNGILSEKRAKVFDEYISNLPSTQPKQCSDCIANGGDWECDHIHCRKGQLPSAQPEILACGEGELNVPNINVVERKTGKWIKLYDDTFHCQLCGHTFIVIQGEDSMNYCPNCGARMEEENE